MHIHAPHQSTHVPHSRRAPRSPHRERAPRGEGCRAVQTQHRPARVPPSPEPPPNTAPCVHDRRLDIYFP
eukprot:1936464-Prymnesium_polylepis.1